MARKANISREEIIEACWSLLDQHQFPNIPRVAAHFEQLDGRRCSNTTLQNAITEWEELYREQQDNELADYVDHLQPAIDSFKREISKAMRSAVDEYLAEQSDRDALKKDAVDGRYLGLTEALVELENQHDMLSQHLEHALQENEASKKALASLQMKHDHAKTQTQLMHREMEAMKVELRQTQLNLQQQQVDNAKLELALDKANQDNLALKQQLASMVVHADQLQNQRRQEELLEIQTVLAELKAITRHEHVIGTDSPAEK